MRAHRGRDFPEALALVQRFGDRAGDDAAVPRWSRVVIEVTRRRDGDRDELLVETADERYRAALLR
jgi:hypothetical protein